MVIEGGPGWSGRENLYTLALTHQPLGAECRACGHRALVPAHKLRRRGHDMTVLKRFRLVCAACGEREWTAVLFAKGDDPDGWVGQPSPLFG
jgi:hypothetical protein